MKEDKQKFYIINVGGVNENGKLIGKEGSKLPPRMSSVREFDNNFDLRDQKILQFQIGNFQSDAKKLIILTDSDVYFYPFNLEFPEVSNINDDPKYHGLCGPQAHRISLLESRAVPQRIQVQSLEDMGRRQSFGFQEVEEESKEQIEQDDNDYIDGKVRIKEMLDYGIDLKNDREVLMLKDTKEQIHLFQWKNETFEYVMQVQTDPSTDNIKFEVLDAALIQNQVILYLVKVKQRVKDSKDKNNLDELANQAQGNRRYTVDPAQFQDVSFEVEKGIKYRVEYYIQYYEFFKETYQKRKLEFSIHQSQQREALLFWKSSIVVDSFNNEFYFKDYSHSTKHQHLVNRLYCRMPIEMNGNENFDSFMINQEIVQSIVGAHKKFENSNYSEPKGLIYDSFMVFDDELVITHGRFMTVVDIQNEKRRNITTLSFVDFEQSKIQQTQTPNPNYAYDNDIVAVLLFDREFKSAKDRWKVIVVIKNGYVLQVIANEKAVNRDYSDSRPSLFQQSSVKKYKLVNFLMKSQNHAKGEVPRLPGRIKKIYKNYDQEAVQPFFLVENEQSKKKEICTFDYITRKLKAYQFDGYFEDYNPSVIFINSELKDYQDVIMFDYKKQEQLENIEQERVRGRILLGDIASDEIKKEIFNAPELLPMEIDNVNKAITSFTCEDYIYFLTPQSINKIFNLTEFIEKSNDKALSVLNCNYPHIGDIYYDTIGETLSAFQDLNTIKVFPLLHRERIKLMKSGKKKSDTQILGVQRVNNLIYAIHSDGIMRIYSLLTSKLLEEKKVKGLTFDTSIYQFHQQINSKQFLIRRKVNKNGEMEEPSKGADSQLGKYDEYEKYRKQRGKDENQNSKTFQINLRVNQKIKVVEYIGLEFHVVRDKFNENQSIDDTGQRQGPARIYPQRQATFHPGIGVNDVQVREFVRFQGPCWISNDNYGLYVGDDLKRITFMYRDHQSLKLNYYYFKNYGTGVNETQGNVSTQQFEKLTASHDGKLKFLKYHSKEKKDGYISQHSTDFKYTIKFSDKTGKIELNLVPLQYEVDAILPSKSQYNRSEQKNIQQQYKETPQLQRLNERIQEFNDYAKGDPVFLSHNEIVFLSQENIIMGYDIDEMKEKFQFSNSSFPDSESKINLESLVRTRNHVLGENTFIHEKYKNISKIAPNNFNCFFQEPAWYLDEDHQDKDEMKYIQLHYKTKLELAEDSYFGFIFRSKDFLDKESYRTEIYTVQTFSFYTWRLLELAKDRIEEYNSQTLQRAAFAQIPLGITLLHTICLDTYALEHLFGNINEKYQDFTQDKIVYYVPVLQDQREKTIFDYLLSNKRKDISNDLYVKGAQDNLRIILEYIQKYPFRLYNIELNHLADKIMKYELLPFINYLDNRCLKTSFWIQLEIAHQDENLIKQYTIDELWCLSEAQNKKLHMESSSSLEETNKVTQYILDVAGLQNSLNEDKQDLMNKIYDLIINSSYTQPYESRTIKALVEIRYSRILKRVIGFELVPYMLLIIMFYVYTIYDFNSIQTNSLKDDQGPSNIIRIILMVLYIYYACFQLAQIIMQRQKYFYNPWNFLDLSLLSFLIWGELYSRSKYPIHVSKDYLYENYDAILEVDKSVRSIYSSCAIIMWCRVLYYFRIFRATGFYIRMLIQIAKDIVQFMFILILVIVAFAHAYMILLRNNKAGEQGSPQAVEDLTTFDMKIHPFVTSSYLLSFGEFAITEDFGSSRTNLALCWTFFILSTLISNIILMNLLISIISETFAKFKENYNQYMYYDMLYLIIENRYLLFGRDNKPLGKYLIITEVNDLSAEEILIQEKIDSVQNMIKEQNYMMRLKRRKQKQNQERENAYVRERLDKIERMLTEMYEKQQENK